MNYKNILVSALPFILGLALVLSSQPTYAQTVSGSDTSSTTSSTSSTTDSTSTSTSTTTATSTDSTSGSTATSTATTTDSTSGGSGSSGSTASSTEATSTSTTGTATFLIRDGGTVAWSGTVSFPIGTSTSTVSPTDNSASVPVRDQSLLGVLEHLAQTTTSFSVSDLQYYSSFGAFYLNCIALPTASSTDCGNWQYDVNGTYPSDSIDQYLLQNGDSVYIYYGSPRQVALSSSTVSTGQSFTATAESYDPSANSWNPISGYTIGITQPDPSNPWSPTEIATSTSDSNGQATFTLSDAGSYNVGLAEDYYTYLTPLTVTAAASSSVATSTDTTTSSGSNTTTTPAPVTVNTTSAFSFLTSHQSGDGSFTLPYLTDWAAVAFALPNAPSSARSLLKSYLSSASVSLSSVTDYERHAMALMALGINPYAANMIDPIVQSFDGTQIGDVSLDNDDIFALIVLSKAGYTASDSLIQKDVSFVLGRQNPSGAWDSSADVTAAAIQALSQFSSISGVSSAISRAETYLHSQQQSDGGFGNGFTTSWVLSAIAARGESASSWTPTNSTSTPLTYLAQQQQTDGAIDTTSDTLDARIWGTAYALPAAEGRSWTSLLQSFAKEISSTQSAATTTTTVATTTLPVATTTLPVASSTPVVLPLLDAVTPDANTDTNAPVTHHPVHTTTKQTAETKPAATDSVQHAPAPLAASAANASSAPAIVKMIASLFTWISSLLAKIL